MFFFWDVEWYVKENNLFASHSDLLYSFKHKNYNKNFFVQNLFKQFFFCLAKWDNDYDFLYYVYYVRLGENKKMFITSCFFFRLNPASLFWINKWNKMVKKSDI